MSLFAWADLSARDVQAGENREGIAAHKYAGLTSFQRTSPRSRRDCGHAAVRRYDIRAKPDAVITYWAKTPGPRDNFGNESKGAPPRC